MRTCPVCGHEKDDRFFTVGKPGVARTPTGWALACRACTRHHSRITNDVKRRYGSLLVQQGGVCKACGRPANGRPLEIDIDHNVWLFRGLVHRVCNNICGMVQDDPETLRSLAYYLEHAWDDRVIQPRMMEGRRP